MDVSTHISKDDLGVQRNMEKQLLQKLQGGQEEDKDISNISRWNETIWDFIDTYFHDNPQALVNHHVESYNDFFEQGIYQIFREKNPLKWLSQYDEDIEDYRSQCIMYMGGRDGSKIHFGKPVLYEGDKPHFLFPNEARLRSMTYAMTIHYDLEIEFINILPVNTVEEATEARFGQVGGDGDGNDPESDDEPEMGEDGKELRADIPIDPVNGFRGGAPIGTKKKTTGLAGTKKKAQDLTPSGAKALREYIEQSISKDPITGLILQKRVLKIENMYLGKFPIMAQSHFCVLHGVPREGRYTMGECRNDPGGYFIIDGKEKALIPQEKFGDNMMQVRKGDPTAHDYLYSCEIKSVSENVTKPIRTLSVRMMAPTPQWKNGQIVVNIPNVRKPVPLFILFRALGILSDREILSTILLDLEKYEDLLDLFVPSIHDGGPIYTQRNAIEYIAYLTKGKLFHHALEILADYFLPHVGEVNYREKAFTLGHMVFRMISVVAGYELPTDRDNFKYKRVELPGSLIGDLFREYYTIQLKRIHLDFERQLKLNLGIYERDLPRLIQDHYQEVFQEGGRMVEDGFKKAFKGNWGAHSHTKRVGVIQDLNRLSFNTMISHLRKTNLPIDASLKIVGPRQCHNSQWGFIDVLDTPDGGNIGIHKHLAISTTVSRGYSREPLIEWMREMVGMRLVTDFVPLELANATKIMVNGYWAGCVLDPIPTVEKIRTYRRLAMLPIHTSVTFDFKLNTIFMFTDAGRLCRPIFFVEPHPKMASGSLSFQRPEIQSRISSKKALSWEKLTRGFEQKKPTLAGKWDGIYTRIHQLYESVSEDLESDATKLTAFLKKQAVIDYLDSSETENTMIAVRLDDFMRTSGNASQGVKAIVPKTQYTHCEIHESLTLGAMGNQIPYPETNPPARNLFSCGQSKQACSLYHTNYQMRMDKTAVVLQYGQIPLVKSRYGEYLSKEENPYGFNAIVAIACYSGYNVEDAILINAGSLARGMFRTTYYSSYSAHESRGDTAQSQTELPIDTKFVNIESVASVITGLKPGFDYSKLDATGMIKEGTPIDDKTMLIGLASTSGSVATRERRTDASVKPKRGQVGYVDKTYMTEGEEGDRIAKVRIREERIPTLGDKFAGRAGQKGTIGMVVPECDMPFTKSGVRPDLIINPHAIPSRMTIGQLIESLTGKACARYGSFADSTAFGQPGTQSKLYGHLLQNALENDEAYEAYGNEVLYNGMTGEQIESSMFLGSVYYMRLKHMVKDKQQSRCLGPRSALTKQPVSGRANEGGLRIGEMERDSLMGHGITGFLTESMMERSDKYHMAICNKTGMMAVYNPTKKLFLSPMSDGPLKFLVDTSPDGTKSLRTDTISKYGRDFSVVQIPYTLKLMMQELQTINISMRIITEDNIQQIESMSYQQIPETADNYIRKLNHLVSEADQDRDLLKRVQEATKQGMAQKGDNGLDKASLNEVSKAVNKELADSKKDEWRIVAEGAEEGSDTSGFPEGYFDTPEIDKTIEPWEYGKNGEEDEYILPEEDRKRLAAMTKSNEWGFIPGTEPMSTPESMNALSNPYTITSYKQEDYVYLKGDAKPHRIWMIQDMTETASGKQIFTLITNDHEGLRPQERIQVVNHTRIEMIPAHDTTIESMQGGGGGRMPFLGETNTMGMNNGMPNIIISPTMINGNGNVPQGNQGNQGDGMGYDSMQGGNGMMGQNPNMPLPPISLNSMGSRPITMQAPTQSEEKKPKGWIQSAIDFTKELVIKKV